MKKKNRIISLIVICAMVLTIAPWSSVISQASYSGALQFDSDGKFTVMQIADTQDNENTYQRIINVITNAVARYHPDLVVFSGDNVIEIISSTSNFKTAVEKIMNPLINTNTKFAVTFGNHDKDETYGVNAPSKQYQYDYFKSYGGSCFVDQDVPALDGVGSGVIPIYANGQTSGTPAYQVYLMDSGSTPSTGDYDACYTSQIDYYIQRSQTYPTVPSLWFQHVIVPDIYSECMTTTNNGTGVSYDGWYLRPDRINWARCSSTVLSDVYNEAPASSSWSLYQSAAHRSSAAYGSKTLYESWTSYGNFKGAYFGHDHLNEFTCTTDDGFELGYGDATTLYKAAYVYDYNDNNPGVSIYQLSEDGSYTNDYVDEQDLATPVYDATAALGTWRVYAETTPNGIEYGFDNGTTDDVFMRLYSGNDGTGDLLYQSPDLVGTESGGNSGSIYVSDVPTTNAIKSIQIVLPEGTDGWDTGRICVYYTPLGSSEQLIWDYNPDEHTFDEGESVNCNTSWFQTYNRTVTFNSNGATNGTTAAQNYVWGATGPLTANGYAKTGYNFAGWATTSTGSVAYSNAASYTMGASNTTLYAVWVPNTYTVVYNGNGSTGGTTPSSIHTYGVSSALSANGFIKTGYTFSGWATSPSGSVVYTNNQNILNIEVSGMTILYAVWAVNSYKVSFHANGGSGSASDVTQAYGSSVALPTTGFTKTGYVFIGWNTSSTATTAISSFTMPATNTTLYAIYTMGNFTVSFDSNGGTGIASPITQSFGTSVTLPAIGFSKTGYTFIGWNTSSSATTALSSYTMPGYNSVLYAIYTINQYSIAFNTAGGSAVQTITQNYGSAVTIPVSPSKTGYTFTGWSPSIPDIIPAYNITCVAQWSANSYIINFNKNDNNASGTMGTQTITFGETATLNFNTFSKTGYSFAGWAATPDGSVLYADNASYTMNTTGVTLYAKWVPNTYTVLYSGNGSTAGATASSVHTYGTAKALTANGFGRTGYAFSGWALASNGTVVYTDMQSVTNLAESGAVTLYAKWAPNSYTVAYDGNGSTRGSTPDSPHFYDTASNLTQNGFEKTGYLFAGWATAPNGEILYSDGQNVTNLALGGAVTLYAKWTPVTYQVTYDANGGTGTTASSSHTYDTASNLTENGFVKTGFSFLGWSTSSVSAVPEYSNGQSVINLTDMNAGTVTFYSVWSVNQYNVSFDANGGTGAASALSQDYGTNVTLPSTGFTKAGYTFIGWNTDAGSTEALASYTVPAYDSTLYAVYANLQYKVTFNKNGGSGYAPAVTQDYNSSVVLPSTNFSKTGCTFIGWNTTSTAVTALSSYNVPAHDSILYAIYIPNQYTVTFDANGGTGGTSGLMAYGSVLTAPAVSRTGYTFTGWSPSVPATVILGGATYTAQWSINSYTVTFDANGGTGGTSGLMAYGSVLTAPAVSRTGYTFTGWSPAVSATVVLGGATYTAQWSINSYTITFDANGGTGGTSGLMTYGTALTAPAVSRAGYTFAGWLPSVPATVPAANTAYTAQWEQIKVMLVFDANGGTGGQSYTSLTPGTPFTPPTVVRTGYTFTGWSPYFMGTVPANNTQYTAQWSVNSYTVTFDANGGTGGTSSLMAYGAALVAPAVSRTGYTFTGWDSVVPSTVAAANTTYTAQWSINSYTVTFDANGGTGGTSSLMAYGTALAAPAVSRAGYILTGWSPAVPATVGAESATYTALWMLLGNVNNDSVINSLDALMALKATSGKITLTDSQKSAADVNKDGKVNSLDALMILRFTSGKIISF